MSMSTRSLRQATDIRLPANRLSGLWGDRKFGLFALLTVAFNGGLLALLVFRPLRKVRVQQQRWDEAQQAYEEAASLARGFPYPLAEGAALYEHGLLHVRRGELEQARGRLEESLAIFRQLAARPYVERAELALQGCS